MSTMHQPYALASEQGAAYWFLGALARVKARGDQTGGAVGIVELVAPPGYETPLHVHADDEAFYILEGEMTLFVGDQVLLLEPGCYAFAPRGIPHGFRYAGPQGGRHLTLALPAGFEQFVVELSEPASNLIEPPVVVRDGAQLSAIGAKYGITILGPLPQADPPV